MGVAGADVAVIGAGIIGASVAYHLAAAGAEVTVLEQADGPAMGSTGLSAAGVRVQFTEAVNVRLSWESIRELRDFEARHGEDVGYRPIGYLLLVPEQAWAAHLAAVEVQHRVGAPVEVCTPAEAAERVPLDPAGLGGATFGPADGVVDPHLVTQAYLRRARGHGVRPRYRSPVVGIDSRGERWRLTLPDGVVDAPVVVNAAGPWAGQIAALAGLDVPVQPVKRMVFLTAPARRDRVYPLTVDLATGFYLRSEADRVLFGRSRPDQPPGFCDGMDWDWLEPTLAVGADRFPWLAGERLDARGSWYGYYEVTPDHNPILGRMPGATSWVNACGFSGHGVQQAPAVGRVVAEEIVEGRARSIDIDPLRHERFATGAARAEQHIV